MKKIVFITIIQAHINYENIATFYVTDHANNGQER